MLLHKVYLDVFRAPNASKPNRDGKIIKTGSKDSVNSVCSFRLCPEEPFPVVNQSA